MNCWQFFHGDNRIWVMCLFCNLFWLIDNRGGFFFMCFCLLFFIWHPDEWISSLWCSRDRGCAWGGHIFWTIFLCFFSSISRLTLFDSRIRELPCRRCSRQCWWLWRDRRQTYFCLGFYWRHFCSLLLLLLLWKVRPICEVRSLLLFPWLACDRSFTKSNWFCGNSVCRLALCCFIVILVSGSSSDILGGRLCDTKGHRVETLLLSKFSREVFCILLIRKFILMIVAIEQAWISAFGLSFIFSSRVRLEFERSCWRGEAFGDTSRWFCSLGWKASRGKWWGRRSGRLSRVREVLGCLRETPGTILFLAP